MTFSGPSIAYKLNYSYYCLRHYFRRYFSPYTTRINPATAYINLAATACTNLAVTTRTNLAATTYINLAATYYGPPYCGTARLWSYYYHPPYYGAARS